jgi:hypothetical protein
MTPLVENRGLIVNLHHFYSSRCNMINIFVQQIMLLTIYLANPLDISQTFDHRHCQHIVEEVCGIKVVVGACTWTLSSWYGAW